MHGNRQTSAGLKVMKHTCHHVLSGRFGVRLVKEVGSGYAGTVYKCLWTDDYGVSRVVAIKVMGKGRIKREAAENEAKMLRKARGPYVVEYLQAVELLDSYLLVTEYCNQGDLHGALPFLDSADFMAREYMRGVAKGLQRLHEILIAHCDIKMKNILISDKNVPKIADFGFATPLRYASEKISICHGTKDYWAPEMWQVSPMFSPFRTDIYALGVTFLGVCERRPLKRKDDDLHQVVCNIKDSQKKELFRGLLQRNPDGRLSLEAMFQNPWLTSTMTPPPSP